LNIFLFFIIKNINRIFDAKAKILNVKVKAETLFSMKYLLFSTKSQTKSNVMEYESTAIAAIPKILKKKESLFLFLSASLNINIPDRYNKTPKYP